MVGRGMGRTRDEAGASTPPGDPLCMADAETDEAALILAAQRDPAVFDLLYTRYCTRIYRYLRARTNSEEEAVDLSQQVFLQALTALPRYRQQGLPFAAWLFRIARNAVTDAHRRNKAELQWDQLPYALHPTSSDNPEKMALHKETIARLRALLSRLDPEKRELIALRFVAELTAKEIAALVGKSEAAVHKQITRTLHALKEQYDEG